MGDPGVSTETIVKSHIGRTEEVIYVFEHTERGC